MVAPLPPPRPARLLGVAAPELLPLEPRCGGTGAAAGFRRRVHSDSALGDDCNEFA